MTEQEKKGDNIDQQLWTLASSLLRQKPDLERFPSGRIVIPDILKTREKEILATCFDGNENPAEDWREIFATLIPENPNHEKAWVAEEALEKLAAQS